MDSNRVVSNDSIRNATASGSAFESSSYFTVPANGVYWYKVTIPADRVIATYNRLWISDLGGMKLEIFPAPTNGSLGSVWPNANKDRLSTNTSTVVIRDYSTAPTVGTGAVDDFVPAGSAGAKSTGGYLPQSTFRIYAPGDYAIKITNGNNQPCATKITYEWIDAPNEIALR